MPLLGAVCGLGLWVSEGVVMSLLATTRRTWHLSLTRYVSLEQCAMRELPEKIHDQGMARGLI